MPMPRRQFRPVRRRRTPGPLAWAGFAGGITMGALAATLITGSNDRPPPQTTQLASGELPEALRNLVAEYLAEEGYQPAAEDAGDEPAPPPGSPVPPAPATPAPASVPVAPASTRGGSNPWPIEFIPEPLALPRPLSPLTVSTQPLDVGAVADGVPAVAQAAANAVPAALRAVTEPALEVLGTDSEPDAPRMGKPSWGADSEPATPSGDADGEPVPLRMADAEPAPAAAAPLVAAEPSSHTALVDARSIPAAQPEPAGFAAPEPAAEPEIAGASVAEVSEGEVTVVEAAPEPVKPKKENSVKPEKEKPVKASVSGHAEAKQSRLVRDTVTVEVHAEEEPREAATLVEAEEVAG
jgi:hypothetical protein